MEDQIPVVEPNVLILVHAHLLQKEHDLFAGNNLRDFILHTVHYKQRSFLFRSEWRNQVAASTVR